MKKELTKKILRKNKIHKPRYIIPDEFFLIIPPEIYINWFNPLKI